MSQMTTIKVPDSERTRLLGEGGVFIQILATNNLQTLGPSLGRAKRFCGILIASTAAVRNHLWLASALLNYNIAPLREA